MTLIQQQHKTMETSKKRKREASKHLASKRARSDSEGADDDEQAQILLLEQEILESKKGYNNIAKLIKLMQSSCASSNVPVIAAISLCRIFTRLHGQGSLTKVKQESEKEVVVRKWLLDRYADYKINLLELLKDETSASTVLTIAMKLLKTEGKMLSMEQSYQFPSEFLSAVIAALITMDVEEDVCKEFASTYVEEYDDIRFYTYQSIAILLGANEALPPNRDHVIAILMSVQSVPDSSDELEDFFLDAPSATHALLSLSQHKKRAQEAWLALLRAGLNKQQRKMVLAGLTSSVAPWFGKPELLMDFLTDCYDLGGSMSLLALSGIFYLIQARNLDYPAFYRKLYSLLDNALLHSKHRSRFFRLLDTFLASTHLPAVLVASFIKRLSRLCLCAPPSAIVVVVPWVYNLLQRHPTCTFMLHRTSRGAHTDTSLEDEGMIDPFIMDEADPMITNALESSLWELVMLQSHYHPNVATLAKIMSEQFTKSAYNLEDFLDHSYGSMLEAEFKKVTKVPVVEYNIPKKILTKYEDGAGQDSLLVKLWSMDP